MTYLIGTTILDTIALRDNSDAAITGQVAADFDVLEAYDTSTPGITATASLFEVGSGVYTVEFTPSTSGSWTFHGIYSDGGVFREYLQAYDIVASSSTDPYAIGATIRDSLIVRDNDDVAITGLTSASFVTVEAYKLPYGTPTTTTSLAEIGDGEYAIAFAPPSAGTWVLHAVYSNGPVFREYLISFSVAASSVTIVDGITRKDIRRRILHYLGDLIMVNASANGSNQTFIDQRRLTGEPNAYRGMQCLIVSPGLNQGEERYITGSTRDNRSVTFDYVLPSDTVIGDEAEIINFRGMGYRFEDVHLAIEYAVESASATATESVSMDIDTSFARIPGTISIPDDWVAVNGVQWQDDTDQPWQNMTASSRTQGSGWSVDRANRTIHVGGDRGYRIDEKSLRIYGFRKPLVPVVDTDVVGVNAEWLTAACVSELSKASYRRMPTREREQMMAIDQQQAGILRSRVLRRTGPNVVVL